MALLRLFNEEAGLGFLRKSGVPDATVEQLSLLGISSICNLVGAIKTARYYEFDSRDMIVMPLTDSTELYQSRLAEQRELHGSYCEASAGKHFARYIEGIGIDHLRELNYYDRKALHNFKYYTWVEQQQRDIEDLNRLWDSDFWAETFNQVSEWDKQIEAFNQRVGL